MGTKHVHKLTFMRNPFLLIRKVSLKIWQKTLPYESTAAYGWGQVKFVLHIIIVVYKINYRIRYLFGIDRSKMASNVDILSILSANKKQEDRLILTKDRAAVIF